MVDWAGLLKYSMQFQDGTKPSEFSAMSPEDRKWLEDAMKQYTFNDTDRLKQVIDILKKQSQAVQNRRQQENEEVAAEESKDEQFVELTEDSLVELLEELTDLVELHPRNNYNLCLMGGMTELLAIIFSHDSDSVRKVACRVFSSVATRNKDVQSFALKAGAINLASQLEREKTPQMRDAIIGCLSAFLNAANFEGKRQYIEEFNGLEQLSQWICVKGEEEKQKYGQGSTLRKIKLKLKILLNDIVLNDDYIMEDPFYVRDTLGKDTNLLNHLLETIQGANFQSPQEAQLREYTLNILYRLYQRNPQLKNVVESVIQKHIASLQTEIQSSLITDDLKEELRKTKDVLKAPTQPMLKNFDTAP